MLNNITYSVNHTELFSIVASSADKYAIVTMTGHNYGYACAFVSVFARTDVVGIHDELVRDVELTKDQITHFLSLDCPDAFIAYALTLCPCPPETSDTVAIGDTAEVDGGNLSYLDQLSNIIKSVDALIHHPSVTTDDEKYDLLAVSESLQTIKSSEYDPAYLAGVSDTSMNCGYCGSSFYRSDYGMCSDCFHNAVSDFTNSARCACGRVLSENDLSLMMCPICAQFKYNDDYDVPVNGMELPSNLE